MRTGKLKRDVTVRPWLFADAKPVTFPAGTAVHRVSETQPEIMWAVSDSDLVARLTGDAKRAEAYNVYINVPDAVEEVK